MRPKLPKRTLLNVYGHADGQRILLGQLAYDARRVNSAFQWSEEALNNAVEWSPLHLPLSPKLWLSSRNEIDLLGLPGLVHDALPDGWGMLLMDRAFGQAGILAHQLTPLHRLAFLADRCWGALEFSPEWGRELSKKQQIALDLLAEEARSITEGDTEQVSQALLVAGGSPHGARPKIMVAINSDASKALVGQDDLPEGYRHVLIKFAGDGEDPAAPVLEYCYGEAARSLGIETAPACLIEAGSRAGLCLDRFDRVNGQKRHVHSMAGMLHTTHRIANSDWLMVADLLAHLRADEGQLKQAFSRAVFNAVFCVRDDHTKNIAFLREGKTWKLAPAFDLAYSDGPGGYHTLTYAHHARKNVGLNDLQRLGQAFGVEGNQVAEILGNTQEARAAMLLEAKAMAVPSRILKAISKRFSDIDRDLAAPKARTKVSRKP